MMKRLVCLIALLLVCVTTGAAPQHSAHRRFLPRLRDKHFWIMAAVQTAGMVADVETTERGIHQSQFTEGNPLFGGGRPGRVKLYSILGSAEIGELWGEHYLKASSDTDSAEGRWKWWTIAAVHTGFHATAAIHNAILLSDHPPYQTRSDQ